MERVPLIRKVLAAAVVGLSTGCITVTPPAKPAPPPAQPTPPAGGVVQAGATEVAKPAEAARGAAPTVSVSMPKVNLNLDKPKVLPSQVVTHWFARVDHLPDPTRGGAMGPGLVGQVWFFGMGPNEKAVPADAHGRLTVTLHDESPAAGGPANAKFLGQWVFEKDALKKLVSVDERWGKNHTLFLPWPGYTLAHTHVRLTTKFDIEGGHTIYGRRPESLVIDSSVPGAKATPPVPIPTFTVPQDGGPPPAQQRPPAQQLPPPTAIPPQAWR